MKLKPWQNRLLECCLFPFLLIGGVILVVIAFILSMILEIPVYIVTGKNLMDDMWG